jgi:Common central domain of tyrosinase
MALGDGIRRNVRSVSVAERTRLKNAILALQSKKFPGAKTDSPPGGVSYWFKQDEIHQATHVHGGPEFLPWHRELCNRFEQMIRDVDPDLSLHYWDWNEDPHDLFTADFMGSSSGDAGAPWAGTVYDPAAVNHRDVTFNPADPPNTLTRGLPAGGPSLGPPDTDIIAAPDYLSMRLLIESKHNDSHSVYIGGTIGNPHVSFRDPFVFLLHSNVDRLFAMWQAQPGHPERLAEGTVYGSEQAAIGNVTLEPWSTDMTTRPWAPPENQSQPKTYDHPSVVAPPCYDTLAVQANVNEVINPGNVINFNDIPTGETALRAASFHVFGCGHVTFEVTVPPANPYSIASPANGIVAVDHGPNLFAEARIWFAFTGGAANTSASAGSVTIHCNETNQDFVFTLQANSIAPPTVGVVLTLDQSGSMADAAGTLGATRMEVLKEAARNFVNLIQPNNGVAVVRFDHDAYGPGEAPFPGLAMTPIGGWQHNDAGRIAGRGAVNSHNTNPSGWTSVGAGIQEAKGVAAAGFDFKAIIVFTDGLENTPPSIVSQIDAGDNRIYAIGLGTEGQVNTVALRQIANNSGGTLLLTGLLGSNPDDEFLLSKFFFQILAGVTNTSIVRDPAGYIGPGTKLRIPFYLNEADIDAKVITLFNIPSVVKFAVEAPSGNLITPANAGGLGATFSDSGSMAFYRYGLPAAIGAGEQAGIWHAVLEVDAAKFKRQLTKLRRTDPTGFARAAAHGVHFSVNVHAWSNIRMKTRVDQNGNLPGSTLFVRATLTEYGVPVDHRAVVRAELQRPDGSMTTLLLAENGPGEFDTAVTGLQAGVYRFRILAEGSSLRGCPFTREELATGAITNSDRISTVPEEPPENLCRFLDCILRKEVLGDFLAKQKIDAAAVRKCVTLLCEPRRDGRPR